MPTLSPSVFQAPAGSALTVGSILDDRYRIDAELGRGAVGAVFAASDSAAARRVAIKVMRPDLAMNPQGVRRFYREAHALRRLTHPAIVAVIGFGVDAASHSPFLVMELVEGETLRAFIDDAAPIAERPAAAIAARIAAALACAHDAGVVHRDLKPDNLMLVSDSGGQRIKVLDFGLAKLFNDGDDAILKLTQTGQMLGTPHYMSPEQVRGQIADARTDLYSLGCITFEMLTSRRPFEEKKFVALMRKHLSEPAPPLPQTLVDGKAPSAATRDLIASMLAKKAEQRPSSAAGVEEAFEAIAHGAESVVATMITQRAILVAPDLDDIEESTVVQPTDLVTSPTHLATDPADVPTSPLRPPPTIVPAMTPRTSTRRGPGLLPWLVAGAGTLVVSAVAVALLLNRPEPVTSTPIPEPTPLVATPAQRPEVTAPATEPAVSEAPRPPAEAPAPAKAVTKPTTEPTRAAADPPAPPPDAGAAPARVGTDEVPVW